MQFSGKLPRTPAQLQALTGYLKRQSSWEGGHGVQGRGIFWGALGGPAEPIDQGAATGSGNTGNYYGNE